MKKKVSGPGLAKSPPVSHQKGEAVKFVIKEWGNIFYLM
jgi:hypothetical protein